MKTIKQTFRNFTIAVLSICATSNVFAQNNVEYDKYFTNDRLRVDLVFAGDVNKQEIFLDGLNKEIEWSGSKTILKSPLKYGEYLLELKNKNGEVIFSKGFNTLFQEWRTTEEAKVLKKAFSSSYTVPFPKDSISLCIYERLKSNGNYNKLSEFIIDPKDKLISTQLPYNYKVSPILNNGNSTNKVDLLFIAEGYTREEMDKFKKDAQKFADYLFELEPYKSRKSDFNIWALESISKESGTDFPHKDIWKNTVANSNFYTFRTDRYLTAPDQKLVSQLASNAPYDALYVIVNTDTYGGGGIYNFYGLSMSNHQLESQVFVHEFGHSFAGLADEYYDSSTAYSDFYNLALEPWEPNITTKVDFDKKWKDMVGKNGVGLYEGGGYVAKGIFRPVENCRMKTNTPKEFCPVCKRAISLMIDCYTK